MKLKYLITVTLLLFGLASICHSKPIYNFSIAFNNHPLKVIEPIQLTLTNKTTLQKKIITIKPNEIASWGSHGPGFYLEGWADQPIAYSWDMDQWIKNTSIMQTGSTIIVGYQGFKSPSKSVSSSWDLLGDGNSGLLKKQMGNINYQYLVFSDTAAIKPFIEPPTEGNVVIYLMNNAPDRNISFSGTGCFIGLNDELSETYETLTAKKHNGRLAFKIKKPGSQLASNAYLDLGWSRSIQFQNENDIFDVNFTVTVDLYNEGNTPISRTYTTQNNATYRFPSIKGFSAWEYANNGANIIISFNAVKE